MRFLDLYISGFGKFHDTAVSFEDGLNVIYGKNEAGKSTIHTFIRGMLFGIERQRGRAARNDIYSKYEPWENSGTYEGQLRLESDDGTIYRIERSFQKNKKEFTVINETTGREEPDGRAVLQEILGGMSETMYNNTISISQLKSATDEGMVSELKNYIANMNTSGNMALNITKATAYLKNQRKQFESQLSPEASVNYTSLLSEIRALERELSSPKYENQLQEYSKLRDSVRNELEHQKIEKDPTGCRRAVRYWMSFPLRMRRPSRRTAVRLKHSTRTISMHRCLPPARDPGFSRCFSLSQRRSAPSAPHTADIWRSSRFRPRGWELVPPPSYLASPLLCFSCWESASHGTGAAAGRRRRKVPLFYRRF